MHTRETFAPAPAHRLFCAYPEDTVRFSFLAFSKPTRCSGRASFKQANEERQEQP